MKNLISNLNPILDMNLSSILFLVASSATLLSTLKIVQQHMRNLSSSLGLKWDSSLSSSSLLFIFYYKHFQITLSVKSNFVFFKLHFFLKTI